MHTIYHMQGSPLCAQYVARCKHVDAHAKICTEAVAPLYDNYNK